MSLAWLLPLLCALMMFSGCGNPGKQDRYDTGPVMEPSEGVVAREIWREAGFEVVETPAGALEGTHAEQGGSGFDEVAAPMAGRPARTTTATATPMRCPGA
jgi:hypothetical protein